MSNTTSNTINKFERRINAKGAVKAEKEFTWFIYHENMNATIKIKKSLEDLGVLIDCISETVKHEIKNKRMDFLMPFLVFAIKFDDKQGKGKFRGFLFIKINSCVLSFFWDWIYSTQNIKQNQW